MADRVIVVGASGFGRESLDVLDAMVAAGGAIKVLGVVDDAPSDENREILSARGVQLLGGLQALLDADPDVRYVLGIGAPAVRERIVARLDEDGREAFTAVHPSATFGAGSHSGEGAVICVGATISGNVTFGRHVHVNPNATIGHDTALGSYVSINPAATISGTVNVGSRALIGASAVVLQNLSIGAGSVVGAGAVVTQDVPDGVTVSGVPARLHERRGRHTTPGAHA